MENPLGAIIQADFLFLAMSFAFPRKERLKSQKQIKEVFLKGKNLNLFPLKIICLKKEEKQLAKLQVAFAVPKRNFKSAVKRNRVKRLLREAYRLHKHTVFNNIEGNYALLFLYLGKEMPAFTEVEKKMVSALNMFAKKISNEKNA